MESAMMEELTLTLEQALTVTRASNKKQNQDLEQAGCHSPFCCSDEDCSMDNMDMADELPPFSTNSVSPSARSISPIDSNDCSLSTPLSGVSNRSAFSIPTDSPSQATTVHSEKFVTLDELHAQIGLTPPESDRSQSYLYLETIFEGVFLETPPKKEFQRKGNLLRRSFKNRALFSDPLGNRDRQGSMQLTKEQ